MLYINLLSKRIIDVLGSILGILIFSPLIIVLSIIIKLTSRGPVFFRQERLGKEGKVFKIYKFRTMVLNAELIGDGIYIKNEKDTRITKVGMFLRSTSLDEIPQLFNVLKGEMSLVGPRPPLTYHPYHYLDYSDIQKKRFLFKPGITGLAQVSVRNSVSWDERIEIDVKYVERFNIILDFVILFKTLFKIFQRENIYTN